MTGVRVSLDGGILCKCKRIENRMTQEKVSGTLPRVCNAGTTQSKMRPGEELPIVTEDGAVGSKRNSQRLAITLKQTQKTMEKTRQTLRLGWPRKLCSRCGYGREYPQGDSGGQSVLLVASRGGSGAAAIRAVVLPREIDYVRRFQPRPQA